MENSDLDELDRLLNRALAASRPQASLGLEARVLDFVELTESTRKRRHAFVLGTLALAASIAVAVLIQPRPTQVRHSPALVATMIPQRAELAVRTPVVRKVSYGKKRRLPSLPMKANVFPSLTPLTPEERALLRFVEQSPETAEKTFAEPDSQGTEPLHIEALKITPLTHEKQQSGERP